MGRTLSTDHGVFQEVDEQGANQLQSLQAQANSFLTRNMAGNVSVSQETINAIQESNGPQRDQAYVGSNANYTGYYLEPGVKFTNPLLTPLRNMTPRTPLTREGKGIDQINARAVLDFFGGAGPSVLAGILGQQGTPNKAQYNWRNLQFNAKQIAWSDVVTDEAIIYGEYFQGDVLATAAAKLIPAWMMIEECWLINSAVALWTPPAPIASAVINASGTLAAGTYWIIVTAQNANGETLGTTAQSVVIAGSNNAISLTLFSVPNNVTAYNVYVGVNAGTAPANSAMWRSVAANFLSGAVPTQTTGVTQGYQNVTLISNQTSGTAYSTVVTAVAGGTLPTLAKDTNAATLNQPLTFDGAQALIYNNAGTYNASNVISQIGSGGLTPIIQKVAAANGALVTNDIDNVLSAMFLNAHADPDYMFCSVADHKKLTYLVSQSSQIRINVDASGNPESKNLAIGYRATKYINQTTGKTMDIVPLPFLMQGTLIFGSYSLPVPLTGFDDPVFRVGVNRELYSRIFQPDQSHQTQTTVTALGNETLVNQYLGGWGMLNGITLS